MSGSGDWEPVGQSSLKRVQGKENKGKGWKKNESKGWGGAEGKTNEAGRGQRGSDSIPLVFILGYPFSF